MKPIFCVYGHRCYLIFNFCLCAAVCSPPCVNSGQCIGNNQCACPYGSVGQDCQRKYGIPTVGQIVGELVVAVFMAVRISFYPHSNRSAESDL